MGFAFEKYPFEKLRELLADVTPSSHYAPVVLTVGEPKFDTPIFITEAVCKEAPKFRYYPKSAGEAELNEAMLGFVKRRFGIELDGSELIPTLGTREVLFNFPQFLLFDKTDPVMAYTNPFYQIYEGAAIASRAKVHTLDLNEENGFKPVIDRETLAECDLVILNFPNNPTGSVMGMEEMVTWVKLAQELDFVLLNDECYSEIYMETPPVSILEAAIEAGVEDFHNILCLNSISKRSSAPGLRSGFIAGDKEILKGYRQYRTYVGAASGLPLQLAAAAAWNDEAHVEAFREKYRKNAALAAEILDYPKIDATFYVWLKVDDDKEAARKLLKNYNITVLPGSFLGRNGAGEGYIRIALVESEEVMRDALTRLKKFIDRDGN